MGQSQVLKLLERQKPKPLTAKEIMKNLRISRGPVHHSLKMLIKYNQVSYKVIKNKGVLEKHYFIEK